MGSEEVKTNFAACQTSTAVCETASEPVEKAGFPAVGWVQPTDARLVGSVGCAEPSSASLTLTKDLSQHALRSRKVGTAHRDEKVGSAHHTRVPMKFGL